MAEGRRGRSSLLRKEAALSIYSKTQILGGTTL